MVLPQLDLLFWRAIAVQLPDPGSFAATCKLARQAASGDDFVLEWFHAHHQLSAPNRPWQYAVVTWQQLKHASAEQIADTMLSYIAYRAERRPAQQHVGIQGAAETSATSLDDEPAEPAAVQLRKHHLFYRYEAHCSRFPECSPLPSEVRRAKQMLKQQRAVDALIQLCPHSQLLLPVYAVKAGNEQLVRQLLCYKLIGSSYHMVKTQQVFLVYNIKDIDLILMCSYAALATGNAAMLRLLLSYSGIAAASHRPRLLRCFAARRSNAACVRELLYQLKASGSSEDKSYVLAAPEHLVMAAARTDAWAAGVVQELLLALQPKQLKPSYMRPAYLAACRTGNMAVLQLLVEVAARAPKQHLPVLLQAAATAGNMQVWQRLLSPSSSGLHHQERMSQHHQSVTVKQPAVISPVQPNQQPATAVQVLVPALDWSCLCAGELVAALHAALPILRVEERYPTGSIDLYQQWDEEQKRMVMADMLWHQLVVEKDKEGELKQYIATEHCTKMLFCYNASPWERYEFERLPAGRVQWLHKHELIPGDCLIYACHATRKAIGAAIQAGQFKKALQLRHWYHLHLTTPHVEGRISHGRFDYARHHTIAGHLRKACAAGDAEAVAQIDRLANFAGNTFFPHQLDLLHPALLETLLGQFKGRAVTMGTLAEEMGLPWQLLERLFQQYCAAKLGLWRPDQLDLALVQQERLASAAQLHLLLAKQFASNPEIAQQFLSSAGSDALSFKLRLYCDQSDTETRHQQSDESHQEQQQQQAPVQAAADQGPEQVQGMMEGGAAADPELAPGAAGAAVAAVAEAPDGGAVEVAAGVINAAEAQPGQQAAGNAGGVLHAAGDAEQQQQLDDAAAQEEDAAFWDMDIPRPADLVRQLEQRLAAGKQGIPYPKQAQLGPIPLWQQALMEVVTQLALPFGHVVGDLYDYIAAPLEQDPKSGLATLQRLLSSPSLVLGPPVLPPPATAPWGKAIAQAAIQLRVPELLHWSLQCERQHQLWGSAPAAPLVAALRLGNQACSPISCEASRKPAQQELDLQELQQHQRQHVGGQPPFAQAAADIALMLLKAAPADCDHSDTLLNKWLTYSVHPSSSQADLARAKAIVAAVAAAKEIPPGASAFFRTGLRQVLTSGDIDLFALCLCWLHRLEFLSVLAD